MLVNHIKFSSLVLHLPSYFSFTTPLHLFAFMNGGIFKEKSNSYSMSDKLLYHKQVKPRPSCLLIMASSITVLLTRPVMLTLSSAVKIVRISSFLNSKKGVAL